MEAVVNYEFLKGSQNEVIVKELSIAAKNVLYTFHFRSPYSMHPHGSAENGLNWDDGIIPYNQMETALSEAVAGYAHLYSYGIAKCKFLEGQIWKTLVAPLSVNLDLDIVVFYLATILISVAQLGTRIPSTSG